MTKNLLNVYQRRCDAPSISAWEAGAWSALMVAVAYWANLARISISGGVPSIRSMIQSVLDDGAFNVLVWVLVLASIRRTLDARPATRRQIGTAFLVGVIALVPVRLAAAAALVILYFSWPRDPIPPYGRRNVAFLFLALALETVWISPIMTQLHLFVGRMDAITVVFLLGLLETGAVAHGNVVDNVTMNFSISVWPYCSSSFQMAAVSVAFVAMTSYLGQKPRRGHLPWLAMSLVASVVLTEMRLMFLAMGQDSYTWWHDGTGALVYSMASLGLAVLFPMLAVRGSNTPLALADHRRVA